MRKKEKLMTLRISDTQSNKLDDIIERLKDVDGLLMINRSSYLRHFIDMGWLMIKENKENELKNLIHREI